MLDVNEGIRYERSVLQTRMTGGPRRTDSALIAVDFRDGDTHTAAKPQPHTKTPVDKDKSPANLTKSSLLKQP